MEMIGLRAHFDGDQIVLDDPFHLKPNTPLLVLVLPTDEAWDWFTLSSQGLAGAYGENEPEYSANLIREANPDYEGR